MFASIHQPNIPEEKRLFSDPADSNKDAILNVLRRFLQTLEPEDAVLEIASGTGQHISHFAHYFPEYISWQPSDVTSENFESIEAWSRGLKNVFQPVILDASSPDYWPMHRAYRAAICINMVHISPWRATLGLFKGAGLSLVPSGNLFLYGPFLINGKPTTESNAAFDAYLKSRDSEWGLRDVADIRKVAEANGLSFVEQISMPANNFVLVFVR